MTKINDLLLDGANPNTSVCVTEVCHREYVNALECLLMKVYHINKNTELVIAELLLSYGACISDERLRDGTLIKVAWDKPELLKLILDKGSNLNKLGGIDKKIYNEALFLNSDPGVLKCFLENGASPNAFNNEGMPILNYAVMSYPFESVKLLIDYGANPTQKTQNTGQSAHQALGNRYYHLTEQCGWSYDKVKRNEIENLLSKNTLRFLPTKTNLLNNKKVTL